MGFQLKHPLERQREREEEEEEEDEEEDEGGRDRILFSAKFLSSTFLCMYTSRSQCIYVVFKLLGLCLFITVIIMFMDLPTN